MNGSEFTGVLRAVIPALVVWLAAKGFVPPDINVADLGAALVTVGAALWSVVSKRKAA